MPGERTRSGGAWVVKKELTLHDVGKTSANVAGGFVQLKHEPFLVLGLKLTWSDGTVTASQPPEGE